MGGRTELWCLGMLAVACGQPPGSETGSEPARPDTAETPAAHEVVDVTVRRLSRTELHRTIDVLLGVVPEADRPRLPSDPRLPFDNTVSAQDVSAAWVQGLETLAWEAGRALAAADVRLAAALPCDPAAPLAPAERTACLTAWVDDVVRRGLGRDLTDADRSLYVELAEEAVAEGPTGTVADAVPEVVATLLQDPELVYRVEQTLRPVDGSGPDRIDDHAIASRLSYLLTGGPPDHGLIDAAEAGALADPAVRREHASRLLATPGAVEQVVRFHA